MLTKYGANRHALPHQGEAYNHRNGEILGPPQRRDNRDPGARWKGDRIVDAKGCDERRQSRMARNVLLQSTVTSRKSDGLRPVLRGHGNRTPAFSRASRGRELLALSRRLEQGERQRSQRRYRQRDEVCSSANFLALFLYYSRRSLVRNPIICQCSSVPEKSDDQQANRGHCSEAGLSGAPPDPYSTGRAETDPVHDFRETTPTSTSTS